MNKSSLTLVAYGILILTLFTACQSGKQHDDLPEIIERGRLVAITSYSPISYFIYHGEPMGYEYELLKMLGEHLDLPVDIKLARDFEEMTQMLETGEGDLIAYGLTITSERRNKLAFTEPLNITRQVLVQRKPENWRRMKLHEIENQLIRSPFDLSGETIHVRRGSAYIERLQNLALEIGKDINIVEAPGHLTTEDLINLVATDSIALTVADENIAQIQSAYYTNIDLETLISLPQQTAWAVRSSSKNLLDTINDWLKEIQKHADYYVIYNKYYKNRQAFRSRYASEFNPSTGGAISPYDNLFQREAERLGWDWRLLAALVYRESQFRPDAQSWAGATGLMQLMPRTASNFGADNPFDPEQNITAGVNFLLWLQNYWKDHIDDPEERRNFVMASYNVGQGHVQDARNLAEHFDADPNIWNDNVESFMLKKSNPDYYNLEIVGYGYASGVAPVIYVRDIYELYAHYQKFIE
jgi:membrane-bound lytic murein transglycosylase F